ncbi:uncharacterized protein TNCV_3532811 [Trichonephila clavipes]|nr:uncharacterized protein TNCV_3532811 [Trichonephila clavipes]
MCSSTAFLGDYLIGPYLLPSSLDGRTYQIFLKVLSELLDTPHVLPSLHHSMWYQHDRAPSHYGIHVREKHLNVTFGQRWIGRVGQVHWSARSLELSSINFFWGPMKSLVYEMPFPSVEDLIARITVAVGMIRDIPRIFQVVKNSVQRCCQTCQTTFGHNFKHLL